MKLCLHSQLPSYALLDSGDGAKLERFGSTIIGRLASQCIWKKKQAELWHKADAIHDGETWDDPRNLPRLQEINIHGISLSLESQPNGQIGFFPEHASYLPLLDPFLGTGSKVLNLFAYTGLASLYCLSKQAQVTHVDLAAHALTKFQAQVAKNGLDSKLIRVIKEEALTYLGREVKRGQGYDVVIADPPSFSRMSKTKFWKIEEILGEIMQQSIAIAQKAVVITCHHPGVTHHMLRNVALDVIDNSWKVDSCDLLIQEAESERCMGVGDFLLISKK